LASSLFNTICLGEILTKQGAGGIADTLELYDFQKRKASKYYYYIPLQILVYAVNIA
jgi:hypothetical protein